VGRRNLEFGCAVMAIGLLAGLAGLATTVLLDFTEHLTYHYKFGSLLDGVTAARALGYAQVIEALDGGAAAADIDRARE
jgi:hypothetical protein